MSKQKGLWECVECGYTQPKWSGSCVQCNQWNSFVERFLVAEKESRFGSENKKESKAVRIREVDTTKFQRMSTQWVELDRLLGGGAVTGSLVLIGGDPGIGKSTLLLQVANGIATLGAKVLYVCGEESVEQTSIRARRLGIDHENLYLFSETLWSAIQAQVASLRPQVLIIDSIQVIYRSELPSSPGSVVQVREVTTQLMHLSKGENITTFLIGHVTKSGELAGPRVLEHIVDVVFDFEGDRQHGFRLLRSVKNRFGPTEDLAIFQMGERGLSEVANPSEIFLEQRRKELPGSAIVPTVEGARAILIEVQALVTSSPFTTPSRRCVGLDSTRLALLLAVLEKRVGYRLHNCDVFVSVAGGMRIMEPAIDLAVVLSIASSFSNKPIHGETIVLGEVGLGGEVRGVVRVESRIREACHLGFKRCILPKKNLKNISPDLSSKISLIGVDVVDEAIQEIF